ncbi:MAG: hypothetical protein Q7S60_03770 [bacterium]|nr:hypothetical protein [bacterium]
MVENDPVCGISETPSGPTVEQEPAIWYEIWRPGLNPDHLMRLIDAGVRAFVIQGYHSGTFHACSKEEHPNCQYNSIPFLEYAREKEIPVFLIFGPFVGDRDNSVGYEPFDKSKPGGYTTSYRMIQAGIVPLRATWQQAMEAVQKLEEVLGCTKDYQSIIREMREAFPFKASLEETTASL